MRLLLVIVGIFASGCATTKAVKMLVQGDTRSLRDGPVDPIAPAKPRILLLALDGVGRDLLYNLLKQGELPELARLISARGNDFPNTYFEPRLLSTLPSSTIPAWTTALTGKPPGEHGVTGNEYFMRQTRKFAAPIPGTFADTRPVLATFTDGYVNDLIKVPTVYELMREREPEIEIWVAMHQIYRGADRLLMADRKMLAEAFQVYLVEGFLDQIQDKKSRDFFELLDNKIFDTLAEQLNANGVPDFLTLYLSGTDQYAHVADIGPDKARTEYLREVLEPKFKRLREILERNDAFEDTYVVVTADHGHTQVAHNHKNALAMSDDKDPPAVLKKADFRLRPFQLNVDGNDDFQAVIAYQGAMAYVYLTDRSRCLAPGDVCPWGRPPRWKEDLVAAAEAFWQNNREGVPVAEMKDTLHLIFIRPPSVDGKLQPFKVYLGDGKTQDIETYLAENPQPHYLALEWRMLQLATGPYGANAGDIILLAHNGNRDSPEERFYFAHRYHSWHGSPSRRDSEIPLIVSHPQHSTETLKNHVAPFLEEAPFQQKVTDVLLKLREL